MSSKMIVNLSIEETGVVIVGDVVSLAIQEEQNLLRERWKSMQLSSILARLF